MVDGVDFKGFWNVRWRAIAKPRGIPFDLPKTAPGPGMWPQAFGRAHVPKVVIGFRKRRAGKKLEGRMR
jgi:hypothetical protein